MSKIEFEAFILMASVPFLTNENNLTISKAKVESLRAQNLFIQVWDYDAGFPGIQNDDYLGR